MASNNAHYFTRKNELTRKARAHTEDMAQRYASEIENCIAQTREYSPNITATIDGNPNPKIVVINADSVSGAFAQELGKTCILNYASYKNPGGMFFNGSSAQEESLCHESFLYNVLKERPGYYAWNNEHKNRALYLNRALYSPDVVFEHNGQKKLFDVVTCAAPNFSAASEWANVSEADNSKAMKDRIDYLFDILAQEQVDTAILGAWGCGVFKQNPDEVARLFKQAIQNGRCKAEKVVFAIPAGPNLNAFKKVFA